MKDEPFDFKTRLLLESQKVERAILDFASQKPPAVPARLWEAMTYSILAGGKRIRPFLVNASGQVFGVSEEDSMILGLALEMIHTASLIHDDLPCMDDDVIRRGKATNHVVFGEALALLAGDALFLLGPCFAAEKLSQTGHLRSDRILEAVRVLLEAAGPSGICGGQTLDTDETEKTRTSPWRIAYWKTAVLFRACMMAPAFLGEASKEELRLLSAFGSHLGIAFQIVDDILDLLGEAKDLGKTPGKDAFQDKNSFALRWGIETAREMAADQTVRAKSALKGIRRDTKVLEGVASYLVSRGT